jgi:hypothetical protein
VSSVPIGSFIAKVKSQLGVRYVYGGDTPEEGFDCSGLLYWAAGQLGISIERTSQAQWATMERVNSPLPGDFVFFDVPSDGGSQPGHVGMVLSPGQMIDAPETGEDVSIQPYPFEGGTVMGYGRLPDIEEPSPPAPTPTPVPVPPEDEDMKYVICNPGPGQPTWLTNGFQKSQLDSEGDVWIWAAAGATVDNNLSAAFLNSLPTV